jgi:hypothetical protein
LYCLSPSPTIGFGKLTDVKDFEIFVGNNVLFALFAEDEVNIGE